jgi:hypothetical protein
MPATSTEPTQVPPWLNPELWSDLKSKISPLQNDIMAPLTHEDLRNFLKSTGRSAPGSDNVQYDVLRFICLNKNLAELDIAGVLLRFLNIVIRQREMPASMKQATLTFIHKSGDPLGYKNYRGISLLSCLFKSVT